MATVTGYTKTGADTAIAAAQAAAVADAATDATTRAAAAQAAAVAAAATDATTKAAAAQAAAIAASAPASLSATVAANGTAIATKALALTRTANVTTATVTAASGQTVPVDTTSNAVAVTAPPCVAGARFSVKVVAGTVTSGVLVNSATIVAAGSDHFNTATGSTTLTLTTLRQAMTLEGSAAGVWTVYDAIDLAQIPSGGSVNTLGTPANPVTSASAARPTGLTVVYWLTATQPTNLAIGDVWESTV